MTGTIDVAALVERLRGISAQIDGWAAGEIGIGAIHWDKNQPAIDEAATALQSQADALAEARGEDEALEAAYKDAYGKVDYVAMAHALSGRLWQMDKRAKAANKRADAAEASLATMREALERAEAVIEKLDKLSLVLESAVRAADGRNRQSVLELIRAAREARALGGSNAE